MPEGKDAIFGRISDLEISPLEYYKLVGNFNRLIQAELSQKLADHAEDFGQMLTIISIGSDARLEKGSFMSPFEVIALTDEEVDLEEYERVLSKTIQKISPTPVAKIIKIKGPESSLVTYNGRYEPGRIADSRFLYGSNEAHQITQMKLGEEIVKLSAKETDHIRNLRKKARNTTEKGRNKFTGTEAMHFDLETGSVFYNPASHQLSFKVGPLRLVQNGLLFEEVKYTRREKDPGFISSLDRNIVNRLMQLSDNRMVNLDRKTVEEIMEHYAFFLRLYHRSERAYAQRKEVVLQLTPKEIEEVKKRLQALLNIMGRFQIKKQPK